jgi:hypothetical protein
MQFFTEKVQARRVQDRRLVLQIVVSLLLLGSLLMSPLPLGMSPAYAAGSLDITIVAGYNLVVDSNVTATSTYAPSVATVMGRFCNTGTDPLTDVVGYIGDGSTPGTYPTKTDPTVGTQTYDGTYAFRHLGGAADAARYIGDLAAGECKVQYWHFQYPQCENLGGSWQDPPCDGSTVATWGNSVKPDDDLSLDFVIWGSGMEGSTQRTGSATWTMTMRNEISAMANKIKPNPDGQWYNTSADTVLPGETITTNGINYELGNVRFGFDNDDNFSPDYNAWLQPFGNPSFDPSCFRLVHTEGQITVTRGSGNPDLVISFDDQQPPDPVYGGPLYFTNLPDDNTGVTGVVYYTFLALSGPCSAPLSPYQEVASGYDNEKFNGDYGTGVSPVGSFEAKVVIDKTGPDRATPGGAQFTYYIPFENTSDDATAGLTLNSGGVADMPFVVEDTVPDGLQYICGSAALNNTLDYSPAVSPGYEILYSDDSGSTWTSVEADICGSGNPLSTGPNDLVMIQWWLTDPLPKHSDSGSGQFTFEAQVPGSYSAAFVENCAHGKFGTGKPFAEACKTTLIEGNNSIGDFVWRDEDRNGLQTGEAGNGIDGVAVTLYLDEGSSVGELDDGDILVGTMDTYTSGSAGYYLFDNLPDARYLVVVDQTDDSLPTGYYLTTAGIYAVDLNGAGDINYVDADFGFGPSLSFDKRLISGDPAYEGQYVIYNIDVTNNRPGNGQPPGPCVYTVWGNSYGGGTGNKAWINPQNIVPAPDSLYATAPYANAGEFIEVSTWNLGSTPAETIQKVELVVPMVVNPILAGTLDVTVDRAGTLYSHVYDAATLPDGTLVVDVTNDNASGSAAGWAWTDFTGNSTSTLVRLTGTKAGNPGGDLNVDAVGYRITTNATCGNPSDTINLLPLTDTFDNTKLQYISARPPATVSGGTLTWSNVGPIYAGQTKTIIVRFLALQPPDTDADGSPEPTTHTNCAATSGGRFADGVAVNDASDCVTHNINPAGTIGDLVWSDDDGNGSKNGSEIGLENVTVRLYDCGPNATCEAGGGDDILVATTNTDASGAYLFRGVPDINRPYQVVADMTTLPGGSNNWTCTYDDSSPFDSLSGPITIDYDDALTNNDDYLGADFGYQAKNNNRFLVGSVWHDRNNSATSTPDAGEEGLSSVAVNACTNSACTTGCTATTTDVAGNFIFTTLNAGTYYVCVTPGTGDMSSGTWGQTWDTDGLGTPNSVQVTVPSRGYTRADYSYRRTDTIQIGDTIYVDWNGDASQDTAEEGINGVTVYLWADDGDGVYEPDQDLYLATTTTADHNGAAGWYNFDVPPGGDYLIVVDSTTLPAGYAQTQDPDESGVCVTCNSLSDLQNLAASDWDQDFGYRPTGLGSVGDRVWQDDDGDGIQDPGEPSLGDITVRLYHDYDGNGSYDPAVDALIAETNTADGSGTDPLGYYQFTGLPAGDYLVIVDTADGDLPTDGDGHPYVLSTHNDPHPVTLAAGESYQDADFGFTIGGALGDYIWQDNNGDGIQDEGEPGIAGVTVRLYIDSNSNGVYDSGVDTLYGTAPATGSDGLYKFTGLPMNKYIVVVDPTPISTWTATADPDETGTCSTCNNQTPVDLRNDRFGVPTMFDLGAGQIDLSRDFGYQPPGVIGDWVWLDANKDGVQDPGEIGIGFVTVYLCASASPCDGSNHLAVTATDSDGYYYFGNRSAGTYYVKVEASTVPAGFALTYDLDSGTTSPDGITAVSVPSGGSNLTADFGHFYDGPYAISGTVFWDSGNDGGLYSRPPDKPYEGVTVYLYDGNGQLIASTTTNPLGFYQFTNLPDGQTFTVVVNPTSGPLGGDDPAAQTVPTTPNYYTRTISGADIPDLDFGFYREEEPPTAVILLSFSATVTDEHAVLLEWETANEVNVLGFNLYRSESSGGPLATLNGEPISALAAGSSLGSDYQFADMGLQPGTTYYYWLEEINVSGPAIQHGPVSAQIPVETAEGHYHVFLPMVNK